MNILFICQKPEIQKYLLNIGPKGNLTNKKDKGAEF